MTPTPMPDFTVTLRTPHAGGQDRLVHSQAHRLIARAGRRGGKTVGIATRNVKRFLEGRRVLYTAPTNQQLDAWWFEVNRALAGPVQSKVYKRNETEHYIEIAGTQNRIKGKTAWNADTMRGDFADDLTFDEWQLTDETAWTLVGAPMLMDNNGTATFLYTPLSLQSAQKSKAQDPRHASKMFAAAKADISGRWEALTWTSHDNPHLSEEGKAEVIKDMTAEAYRLEILAQDDELEANQLVYGMFNELTQVKPRFVVPKNWLIYSGHDFGAVNGAALFFARDPMGRDLFAFHEYCPARANSPYDRVREFKRVTDGYQVIKSIGGSHQEAEARAAYSDHQWSILEPAEHLHGVLTQVDRVRDMYRNNRVYIFDDLKGYLNEIRNCLWKLGPDNKPMREILNEKHYHLAACARYILSDFAPEAIDTGNIRAVNTMVRR